MTGLDACSPELSIYVRPCSQHLKTAALYLPVYWVTALASVPRPIRSEKSKAPQEKVSSTRQHFLSHHGLWQHPSDFNCPDHR
jgi:hypothetical protein